MEGRGVEVDKVVRKRITFPLLGRFFGYAAKKTNTTNLRFVHYTIYTPQLGSGTRRKEEVIAEAGAGYRYTISPLHYISAVPTTVSYAPFYQPARLNRETAKRVYIFVLDFIGGSIRSAPRWRVQEAPAGGFKPNR
eukprot:2465019-Pyramimonas_sp.AAC.1